jgi:hypothetical protein
MVTPRRSSTATAGRQLTRVQLGRPVHSCSCQSAGSSTWPKVQMRMAGDASRCREPDAEVAEYCHSTTVRW